jgi:hypothetical protein
MLRTLVCACVFSVCLGTFSVPAMAQEVVHALTGTVSSLNPAARTITLFQDNGSQGVFNDIGSSKTRYSLDKKIAARTTAVGGFNKNGAYVIVFYFGNEDARTAVALKNLGTGPFTSAVGMVANFEARAHTISVTDASGAVQTFRISADTIAEGSLGVEEGLKFQVQKGDRVRVVGTTVDGTLTALFLSAL